MPNKKCTVCSCGTTDPDSEGRCPTCSRWGREMIATCPCGEVILVPSKNGEYQIHKVECPNCERQATAGNSRTGEITGWMTRKAIDAANDEYAAQLFSADNNELYGRGNW